MGQAQPFTGGVTDRLFRINYILHDRLEFNHLILPYHYIVGIEDIFIAEPHNQWLGLILKYGVIGVVLIICFMSYALVKIRSRSESLDLAIFIGITMNFVGLFYHPFLSIQLGCILGTFVNEASMRSDEENVASKIYEVRKTDGREFSHL